MTPGRGGSLAGCAARLRRCRAFHALPGGSCLCLAVRREGSRDGMGQTRQLRQLAGGPSSGSAREQPVVRSAFRVGGPADGSMGEPWLKDAVPSARLHRQRCSRDRDREHLAVLLPPEYGL
jgi:hypothetical protein